MALRLGPTPRQSVKPTLLTIRTFTPKVTVRGIGSSRTRSNVNVNVAATDPMGPGSPGLEVDHHQGLVPPGDGTPQFIKHLSVKELMGFTMLAVMTSSPRFISLSAKLLPYTPNLLVKSFVYPIYCGGENCKEVLETGGKLRNRGIGNMMLSYSVEDAEGTASPNSDKAALLKDAVPQICRSIDEILVKNYDEAAGRYRDGLSTVAPSQGFVALKPSGLTSDSTDILRNFDKPEYAGRWQKYLGVCREICQYCADHGEGKVVIVFDAEKTALQSGVYAAQRAMMEEFNRDGETIVIGTVQMYLQGSVDQVKFEMDLARKNNYLLGLKLVRGAYLHSEPDRWNTIHRTKEDSDRSYDQGVALLLDDIIQSWKAVGSKRIVGKVVVASHNERSAALVDEKLRNEAPLGLDVDGDDSVVFGQLMGMADDQSHELAKRGRKVIKYVPWGPTNETKEYLVRRLQENGDAAREGGWVYFKHGVTEMFNRVFTKAP
jgi:proline dehydrogenase